MPATASHLSRGKSYTHLSRQWAGLVVASGASMKRGNWRFTTRRATCSLWVDRCRILQTLQIDAHFMGTWD